MDNVLDRFGGEWAGLEEGSERMQQAQAKWFEVFNMRRKLDDDCRRRVSTHAA